MKRLFSIFSFIVMTCIVQNNVLIGMHDVPADDGSNAPVYLSTGHVLRTITPRVLNQSPQETQTKLRSAHNAILASDLQILRTALENIPQDIIATARLCNIVPQDNYCNCIARLLRRCDRNQKDRTLFHLAITQRALNQTPAALQVVEYLLQFGFDLNTTDYPTGTAVHAAASKDDINLLRLLLQQKYNANLNILNRISMTPLVSVLRKNNKTVVQLLLEAGADPFINWNGLPQERMTTNPEIRKMILARKAALQAQRS